ncbi:MAG: hypothetical protein JSS66_00160 [Armatimonadetes bacterium]|nr:hypothetical protein [Armatimonadota bacterium]
MARYDNSTINNDALAMAFNEYVTRTALPIAARRYGFVSGVLGAEADIFKRGDSSWAGMERIQTISGNKYEFMLEPARATYASTVQGSSELAALTASMPNQHGANEFGLTLIPINEHIPNSRLQRLQGPNLKGAPYVDQMFEKIRRNWIYTLAAGFSSNNNQSDSAIGGWNYAIASGNVYGNVDRSDSTNADYRGVTASVSGAALTLADIDSLRINVMANGGLPTFAVCNAAVMKIVYNLVRTAGGHNLVQYENGGDRFLYSAPYFSYAGIAFLLDEQAPSQTLGVFTPDTWSVVVNEGGFNVNGIMDNPGTVHGSLFRASCYAGLFCKIPGHNGKIYDIIT